MLATPRPELPRSSDPVRPRSRAYRVGDVVLALTVVLGALLRMRQYLYGRSLWFDELMIATNVRDRNFVSLTRQLTFSQAAPLGFLWSTKASILAFGQSELGYRLVPFLAGVVTVGCVALVARRVFMPVAAIAAAATIALAGQSIHYSSEFKQYTLEAAVASSLLLVASHCLGRSLSDEPRRPVLLAVAGAVALTCSISAIFVLAGVAVVLVVQTVRSRRYEHYVALVSIAVTWAAAAAAMYVVSWSKDARNTKLHAYWKAYFGPAPWSHPRWYLSSWLLMIKTQVGISWSWAALGLTIVVLLWLARRTSTLGVIALVTMLSTAIASWAGVYPFNGRLLLFLVPTVCLIFGAVVDAVETLFGRFHPAPRWLAASACAVILVSGSVNTAWANVRHPFQFEEVRQVLEAMRPQFRPGDRLFIADYTDLAYFFYRDRTGFGDVHAVVARPTADRVPGFLQQIEALGPGPTWLLFSRVKPGTVLAREALYLSAHDRGKIVARITRVGAFAVEIEQTR